MAHSMGKRPFSVTASFSYTEYLAFSYWYNTVCKKGVNSFRYPRIDMKGNVVMGVYRFAEGSAPSYSNVSGDNIKCVMEWEEV